MTNVRMTQSRRQEDPYLDQVDLYTRHDDNHVLLSSLYSTFGTYTSQTEVLPRTNGRPSRGGDVG